MKLLLDFYFYDSYTIILLLLLLLSLSPLSAFVYFFPFH